MISIIFSFDLRPAAILTLFFNSLERNLMISMLALLSSGFALMLTL
jgi:hypothetical protein